jgi:hypothetical protein
VGTGRYLWPCLRHQHLPGEGGEPDYLRWGYPDWFHFVSGGLDLVAALLLMAPATRVFGVALGCAIMLAAVTTVTYHREYKRALPPVIVLGLLAIVGWAIWT